MNIKLSRVLILTASISLVGCQTTEIFPPKTSPYSKNTVAPTPDILDSDGDGVPDDIDECPATPLNVVVDERGCLFTMPGVGLKMEYRAFFAKGSSELSKEYQLALDKVAEKMREYDTATMLIIGTASVDEINETSSANLQLNSLSKDRVLMVKNYLLLKHQINPNRLSTFACGTSTPIAPSDTEEQRSLNRRVYGVAEEIVNEELYNKQIDSYAKICIEFK